MKGTAHEDTPFPGPGYGYVCVAQTGCPLTASGSRSSRVHHCLLCSLWQCHREVTVEGKVALYLRCISAHFCPTFKYQNGGWRNPMIIFYGNEAKETSFYVFQLTSWSNRLNGVTINSPSRLSSDFYDLFPTDNIHHCMEVVRTQRVRTGRLAQWLSAFLCKM